MQNEIPPRPTFMNLNEKVVLIAGGTRMGSAVAQAFAKKGCRIALTWRSSRKAVDGVVAELQAQGHDALSYRCDLSNPSMIQKVVGQIGDRFGRLDIVVNLASIYGPTPLQKGDPSKVWDDNLSANAKGGYLLSIAVAQAMRRSGGGRIVHISDWTSVSGRPRYRDYAPYYVSKTAVKAVVEALALELSPDILVNGIAPGPILPPPGLSRQEHQAVVQSTPLRRWGGPEEIAKAAVFLAETDFVTGEVLRVDGGRHLY